MASTVTVNIIGDASRLRAALGQSEGMLSSFSNKARSFGAQLTSAGRRMTFGITAPVAALGKVLFDELQQGQKVAAQTRAVIASTGGVANVTARDVDRLSSALLRKSGIDDEVIHAGANLLLTFKEVHNEVGRGNDIFNRATKAALDLSVAGFGDMNTTAKQLGKALNDPIRGMTALSRAGVTFTDSQKATIKALVESGDLLGAQKVILAEVESQVGGSAEAYGKTLPGQIGKAVESLKNVGAAILKQVLPAFVDLTKVGLKVAQFFGDLPKPIQMTVLALVGLAAVAGPLVYVMGALATAFGVLTSPITLVAAAVAALVAGAILLGVYWDKVWKFVAENPYVLAVLAPLGAVLLPIIALVGAVRFLAQNWDAAWKWIKQAASDAYNALRPIFQAIASVLGPVLGVALSIFRTQWAIAWGVVTAVAQAGWGTLSFVFNAVASIIRVVAAVATAGFGAVLAAIRTLSGAASAAWGGFISALNWVKRIVDAVVGGIRDAINGALGALRSLGNAAKSASPLGLVKGLLGFAEGGAVPGPRGAPRLAVVHGGEYVVPAEGALVAGSGSGGQGAKGTYYVTVHAGIGTDGADVGRQVVDALKAYESRNGVGWRN